MCEEWYVSYSAALVRLVLRSLWIQTCILSSLSVEKDICIWLYTLQTRKTMTYTKKIYNHEDWTESGRHGRVLSVTFVAAILWPKKLYQTRCQVDRATGASVFIGTTIIHLPLLIIMYHTLKVR